MLPGEPSPPRRQFLVDGWARAWDPSTRRLQLSDRAIVTVTRSILARRSARLSGGLTDGMRRRMRGSFTFPRLTWACEPGTLARARIEC
jgi:hypothetical protein